MVSNDSGQFLHIHLDGAVSCKTYRTPAAGDSDADGGREVVSHGSGARVRDETTAFFQLTCLIWHDAGSRVAADNSIVARQHGEELVDGIV